MLQRRLAPLRLRERQAAAADGLVQLVLDLVDLRRTRIWLRPQVARISRVPAELEADQMVLLERGRRPAQAVLAQALALEVVGVGDGRADGARPAAPADRRANRRLSHAGVQHTGRQRP